MHADGTIEATFCFIDIAGYTALTNSHGEIAAANLVDEFRELIRISIEPSGQLQSLIGDCAFVTFPDPPTAAHAVSALYKLVADRQNFPVVRTGMHHGSALVRASNLFGSTVNLAARVTAQATGGRIMCTEHIAQVLSQSNISGIGVQHAGRVSLKNIPEPVDLYEILLSSQSRVYAIDPVCKMQVDISRAAGELHVDGKNYWFCSLACVERFATQPSSYLPPA